MSKVIIVEKEWDEKESEKNRKKMEKEIEKSKTRARILRRRFKEAERGGGDEE